MMPPKDDLVALTGGYRGTPVLQIGADVYVDSQRIARELERASRADAVSRTGTPASPTRRSSGPTRSSARACTWRSLDERYLAGASSARTGRAFPGHRLRSHRPRACASQLRAHAGLVEQQLARRPRLPRQVTPRALRHPRLDRPWFARHDAGRQRRCCAHSPDACVGSARRPRSARDPRRLHGGGSRSRAALTSRPEPGVVDARDAQPCGPERRVEVCTGRHAPRRGSGHRRRLGWQRDGRERPTRDAATVVVHFPRLGYRVGRSDQTRRREARRLRGPSSRGCARISSSMFAQERRATRRCRRRDGVKVTGRSGTDRRAAAREIGDRREQPHRCDLRIDRAHLQRVNRSRGQARRLQLAQRLLGRCAPRTTPACARGCVAMSPRDASDW